MQFIAYLTGNPAIQGYHRRDFKWMPEHKCYVYLGRPFTEKEFNALMPVIWKKYREVYPQFRILPEPDPVPAPAPASAEAPTHVEAPNIVSTVIDAPETPVTSLTPVHPVVEPPTPVTEKVRKPAPRPPTPATVPR